MIGGSLSCAVLWGEPIVPDRTKTIQEIVLGRGNSRPAAEEAAMREAELTAHEGVFKVKRIAMDRVGYPFICQLTIEHRIRPFAGTVDVSEVVVGYGFSPESAIETALSRLERRIRSNPMSYRQTMTVVEREQMRVSSPTATELRGYWITSFKISGHSTSWQCDLTFVYPERKTD